jgi:hypothetical protein
VNQKVVLEMVNLTARVNRRVHELSRERARADTINGEIDSPTITDTVMAGLLCDESIPSSN